MVNKQARVVGEVVVSKDVGERTETVRDTLRRTDVDVEQIRAEDKTRGHGSGWLMPTVAKTNKQEIG